MPSAAVHFSIAYWCVFIAAVLPILCAGVAKYGAFGRPRGEGGFDNGDPRGWLARQTGWRARANAAQANGFEALPFFIGAVFIAGQLGAAQAPLDILAFLYVVLRLVYIALYLADLSAMRSVVWALAFAVNAGILFLGYR